MREVTAALQAATGADLSRVPMGTDGCSIPTYGVPLHQLALAFARVATGVGLNPERARAAARLRAAVAGRLSRGRQRPLRHPGDAAPGRTGVLQGRRRRRVLRRAARTGLGVAIKVDDGNNARAAEVVMAAVIEALVRLEDDERAFMHSLSDMTLRNWNGIEVGALRASAALRAALA